jgi:putative tryptophan/tyrosine transport system substrate-binding protein
MRRREFITLVGGAAASWPLNVCGEQREPMRRIGILMHTSDDDLESRRRITTLLQALQKLGWTDGQNVRIDYRWAAGDTDRARVFAKELIELKPDVLFANGSPQAPALIQATRSIPIVFVNISDPVGAGLVANLARPGGNVTGFSNGIFQIAGEQLELLKEIAPSMTRVAVMYMPDARSHLEMWREIETQAPSLRLKATAVGVRSPNDIERAFAAFAREPNGGLAVFAGSVTQMNRKLIIALAARHHLPAVYQWRYFADDGGLMAYGPDPIEIYRQAASYVDRILRGEAAGDLPVQLPTKYELVINLKVASALGLTVPRLLLARATVLID